jgi:hypothetical protein
LATLSLGDKYRDLVLQVWGLGARLTSFRCRKKNIVAKSKEVKTGQNLAEPSEEGCG